MEYKVHTSESSCAVDRPSSQASVLVVQSSTDEYSFDAGLLTSRGIAVTSVKDTARALTLCSQMPFDAAILCGVSLATGLFVRRLKQNHEDLPILVLRHRDSDLVPDAAVDEDLFAYLPHTLSERNGLNTIRRAIEHHKLGHAGASTTAASGGNQHVPGNGKVRKTEGAMPETLGFPALVGSSDVMRRVRQQIKEVGPSDMTVLILGESGTGKEVVARLVHAASHRAHCGSFIKVNCPAVPAQLVESELFGHEAGAFTGAAKRKPGLFELAAHGTMFLDEMGEVPLSLQPKLLQVLEQKQLIRVGGDAAVSVDARVVSATSAPLAEKVADGSFRADLFYRLNQYPIVLPALRERAEDVPELVAHFLRKYGAVYGRPDMELSSSAMAALTSYAWPGNVRELEAAIHRFALTRSEESIFEALSAQPGHSDSASTTTYRAHEKRLILSTLARCEWNRREAAKSLGLSYNTLRRRIAEYRLAEQNA